MVHAAGSVRMVPAQALASLALCWQPQRHYGASTASIAWRVDGVRGGSNGQHEFGTWKQSKTARAGAGRVGSSEPSRHASTRPRPPTTHRSRTCGFDGNTSQKALDRRAFAARALPVGPVRTRRCPLDAVDAATRWSTPEAALLVLCL